MKNEIAMKQTEEEDHKGWHNTNDYYNIMLCQSPTIHQLMFPMAAKR